MKTVLDGAVVTIDVWINTELAVRFVTFPNEEEETVTLQTGDVSRVELLVGFLLLLTGSKLLRPAEKRVVEGILRRIDKQIADETTDPPPPWLPGLN